MLIQVRVEPICRSLIYKLLALIVDGSRLISLTLTPFLMQDKSR